MESKLNEKPTCILAMKAGKTIKEIFRINIEKHGILHGHALTLYVLFDHGTISQIQLSRILNIKPASVSTVLQSMKKEELITRTPDPSDDRIMLTSLTEKGKLQAETVVKTWDSIEKSVKDLYTDEEFKQLRYLCSKILNNLSDSVQC